MKTAIDPKVDYIFKRLFGREENEVLLLSLTNAVLQWPPGLEIRTVTLLNPFQEKDYDTDKLSILDIKARDQAGRLYNIEMQLLLFGALRARVLYYWARVFESQLSDSEEYAKLRPTISILFVNATLFPLSPEWHGIFELRERKTGLVFSDQLQLHVLEIPKFKMTAEELQTPLERWLYFLKHGAELDPDELPAALHGPEYQQAVKEMTHMTQSELERERYESRLKAQRDLHAILSEADLAERRGMERGMEKGIEKGMEKGMIQARIEHIHSYERFMRRPPTPTETLAAQGLDALDRRLHELESEIARTGIPASTGGEDARDTK